MFDRHLSSAVGQTEPAPSQNWASRIDSTEARPHPAVDGIIRAFERSAVRWGAVGDPFTLPLVDGKVDLLVDSRDVRRATTIMAEHHFTPLPKRPGSAETSFLTYHRPSDQWVLIRLQSVRQPDSSPVKSGADTVVGKVHRNLGAAAWLPSLRRRPGLTIALLGPDGCGKSSLAELLEQSYYFPVRRLYMGLWSRARGTHNQHSLPGSSLASRLLQVWRQYLLGQYHRMRGHLVVFDRYTYDALLPRSRAGTPLARMYSWTLGHACPAPDMIFVLDVPGEVMFARKHEASPEDLEAQRQDFLALRQRFPQSQVLDADRPQDAVRADLLDRIWRHQFGR